MRNICCLAIAFLLVLSIDDSYAQNPTVPIRPKKTWIQKFPIRPEALPDTGQQSGYYYLQIEKQHNVRLEEANYRYAYKLLTSEGVQQMSDITVSFDPKYETLIFHDVILHRSGQRINKLPSHIKTIQQEESMDRFLYDESFTAIINVHDVRVGDILEYSYTIKGINPVFKGRVMDEFYADMRIPFDRKIFRLIVPNSISIHTKNFNTNIEPAIDRGANEVTYLWTAERSAGLMTDTNVPAWYNPFQRVMISSFKNWQEVSSWGTELYKVSDREKELLKDEADKVLGEGDGEEFVMKAIRFVQDDIRYLGFESGLNGFKPHSPLSVWNQRFGDCKDKSLLLCTILQSRGIEAYPVLVNTVDRGKIAEGLPSAIAFDHCVAQIKLDGKTYNVDPTIGNQGGSLDAYYFPVYQMGLPLNTATELTTLIPSGSGRQKETQIFKMDSVGGMATMEVHTFYEGRNADAQRSWLANTRRDAVQKSYKDYYADQYPDITMTSDLIINDNREENQLTTIENYRVKTFWEKDAEKEGRTSCTVKARPLQSYFDVSQSLDRSAPYGLEYPFDKTIEIRIHTPIEWSILEEKEHVETDYYKYDYSVTYQDSVATIKTAYQTKSDAVPVVALGKFIADHEKFMGNLSYQLSWTPSQGLKPAPKWPGLVALVLIFAASIYFAYHAYVKYDPQPFYPTAWGRPVGGWLILAGIGVTLSPVYTLVQYIREPEYITGEWWVINLVNGNMALSTLGLIEQIYNIGMMIFSLLIVVLFYQRRSSIPNLMIYYYGIPAVWIAMDAILVEAIAPGQSEVDSTPQILRAVITAAIWIPYFRMSQRVKRTFVNKRDGQNGEEMVAVVTHQVEMVR